MAKSAAKAGGKFLKSGMQTVSPQEFENRMTICRGCEFWNPKGFAGSGQCLKCGCSTQAKLRMATESCPIQKWVASVS